MRRLLTLFWKPLAVTVRRPGARPLFEWLFQGEDLQALPAGAIVRTSWRGEDGARIVYGFPKDRILPSVVAKTVPAHKAAKPAHERNVLSDLSITARRTGVQVPAIVGTRDNERYSSQLLSFIPGRSVSDWLELSADRFSSIMSQIVDWLESWNRATVVNRPLKRDQLEQALLNPLDQMASSLEGIEKYRGWLVARSLAAVKYPVPLVAAHNDLTMSNVLLDEKDRLGVVDWETACLQSLPLGDFYYAVTDAVRIVAHSRDWLSAFKSCFLPGGSSFAAVTAWQEQLQSAIDLPASLVELCFHACWLHHAFNEYRTSQPGRPRPFFEIVQWLALDVPKFNCN